MLHLPEKCQRCKKTIGELETCVLPGGEQKRGAEVTFKESAEGGVRCRECAPGQATVPLVVDGRVVAGIPCEVERL